MKKLSSLLLALCLLACCSVPAFAGEAKTIVNDSSNKTLTIPDVIAPFGWSGGAAPQITKIELYDYGWLKDSGNWGVILKVTGYGNDNGRAYFNGKSIQSERLDYFINSGTTADGWYWLYDCGPITEPGRYDFETTFKSTNAPYNTLKYSTYFEFVCE